LNGHDQPLVSVVIPTWNAHRYLRTTLDSVFQQTFPSWEIVLVDDASTDDTLDIARSFGERVRIIARSKNSGTADIPRYQGVEASRGKLVALLDSDDLWLKQKLERQVAFMQSNPDIPLVHHYVRLMDAEGKPGSIRHEGIVPPTGPCARELLSRCFICTSSVLVRRDDWLGAQNISQLTGYGTELDFFLSLARKSHIGFIPEPLGSYRVFPGSISRKNWKRYPRDVGAMERIYHKGLWEGVASRQEMKAIIHEASLESADAHRDRGCACRSMYFCALAARYRPLHPGGYTRAAKAVGRAIIPIRKKK